MITPLRIDYLSLRYKSLITHLSIKRQGFSGSSAVVLAQAQVKVRVGCSTSQGLAEKRVASSSLRAPRLAAYGWWHLLSSLTICWLLLLVIEKRATLYSSHSESRQVRRDMSQPEIPVSKSTPRSVIYWILFIRSKSLGPAYTGGERIKPRCEYQEVATCHSCLLHSE